MTHFDIFFHRGSSSPGFCAPWQGIKANQKSVCGQGCPCQPTLTCASFTVSLTPSIINVGKRWPKNVKHLQELHSLRSQGCELVRSASCLLAKKEHSQKASFRSEKTKCTTNWSFGCHSFLPKTGAQAKTHQMPDLSVMTSHAKLWMFQHMAHASTCVEWLRMHCTTHD